MDQWPFAKKAALTAASCGRSGRVPPSRVEGPACENGGTRTGTRRTRQPRQLGGLYFPLAPRRADMVLVVDGHPRSGPVRRGRRETRGRPDLDGALGVSYRSLLGCGGQNHPATAAGGRALVVLGLRGERRAAQSKKSPRPRAGPNLPCLARCGPMRRARKPARRSEGRRPHRSARGGVRGQGQTGEACLWPARLREDRALISAPFALAT